MTAMVAQCKWEIRRQFRNRRYFFFTLLIPLFYYFLFVKLNGAAMKIGGTTWNTYFMVSMATFSVIGSAINGLAGRIAFERTQGWMKLVQTTPLPPITYMGSKIVGQFILGIFTSLVVYVAAAAGEGVQLAIWQWLVSILWINIGALPFIALGTFIGLLGGAEATAMIANGVYLVLSILGGLWWPITLMPHWLQLIAKQTPTYRLAHGAWQIAGGHAMTWHDIISLVLYFVVFSLLSLWVLRHNRTPSF